MTAPWTRLEPFGILTLAPEGKMSEAHPLCELCGEPMPLDEVMFKFHGFSGPCPKPPLPRPEPAPPSALAEAARAVVEAARYAVDYYERPDAYERLRDALAAHDAAGGK